VIPLPRPAVPYDGCPFCGSVERPCCEETPKVISLEVPSAVCEFCEIREHDSICDMCSKPMCSQCSTTSDEQGALCPPCHGDYCPTCEEAQDA
jgi:hypothetical protein